MREDSALRSTLEDLKALHDDGDAANADAPSQAGPKKSDAGGDSLLASLLSETKNETQRELDQIKAALEARKQAEEEAQRTAELERRRQLDALREQEARRREDMMRQRERKAAEAAAPAQAVEPVAAPIAEAEPQKKSAGWIVAIAASLIAGIAAGGWYMSTRGVAPASAAPEQASKLVSGAAETIEANRIAAEKAAAEQRAAEIAEAKAKAEAEAAAKAEAERAAAKAAEMMAPLETRAAEADVERYQDRRFPEMMIAKADKPRRRYGKRPPRRVKKRDTGIKIKALDLDKMR